MSVLGILALIVCGACALALPVIAVAGCIRHWNDEPLPPAPVTWAGVWVRETSPPAPGSRPDGPPPVSECW